MSRMNIYEIEYKNLLDDYIWSNFNLEDALYDRKFYRIEYDGKILCEIRGTYASECCMFIEIGIIRIRRLCTALTTMINFLNNNKLKRILTCVTTEDKFGIVMLKMIGFTLDVELREYVKIKGRKTNIQILGIC